jgi:HEAT repeat protein
VLAGREAEAGRSLNHPEVVGDLLEVSVESDPLLRQMAAFDLGLFPGEKAQQRLKALLGDADASTRANAAVGLARQGSVAGLPVLEAILKTSDEPVEPQSDAAFARFLALKNCVHALELLTPRLDAAQLTSVAALLAPIAEKTQDPRIRVEAEKVLIAIRARQ